MLVGVGNNNVFLLLNILYLGNYFVVNNILLSDFEIIL